MDSEAPTKQKHCFHWAAGQRDLAPSEVLGRDFEIPSCTWLAKGLVHGGSNFTRGEYNPLISQILWYLARMECEELRQILRQQTTEKQKLEHGLPTLMDVVLSPFRLKLGLPYPGKCSNHSATEWKRNRTIFFLDSCSIFLNRLFDVLV